MRQRFMRNESIVPCARLKTHAQSTGCGSVRPQEAGPGVLLPPLGAQVSLLLVPQSAPALEVRVEETIQQGLRYRKNYTWSSSLLLITMVVVLLPSLWAL